MPDLRLEGDLDIGRVDYLEEQFQSIRTLPHVTIDLREVHFVDASAVARFIRLHNAMQPVTDRTAIPIQARIRLINVRPNIARLFSLLQLASLFEILATEA